MLWLFRRHSLFFFFYRVSLLSTMWLGKEQRDIYTYFTCLHTGDSTTPLLSVQRVSSLRFVGINKHDNYRVPYAVLSLFEGKGVE